jgi:hypothetical protein
MKNSQGSSSTGVTSIFTPSYAFTSQKVLTDHANLVNQLIAASNQIFHATVMNQANWIVHCDPIDEAAELLYKCLLESLGSDWEYSTHRFLKNKVTGDEIWCYNPPIIQFFRHHPDGYEPIEVDMADPASMVRLQKLIARRV